MLVGSPSTHSAHKLQSRVSIDLTGDEAAAAPVALPSATDERLELHAGDEEVLVVGRGREGDRRRRRLVAGEVDGDAGLELVRGGS